MNKNIRKEINEKLRDAIIYLDNFNLYSKDLIQEIVDLLKEIKNDFVLVKKDYIKEQLTKNLEIEDDIILALDSYRLSTTFRFINYAIVPKNSLEETKERFIEYTVNDLIRVLEEGITSK